MAERKRPIVEKVEAKSYWWCTCGKSEDQPFCDGSHKGSSFIPKQIIIEESKTVAWCTCKETATPPYCDGSHSKI
jgi:CDGSH-type Zn-finger protein